MSWGRPRVLGDTSNYADNATAPSKRYESLTTRSSQEMEEQWRRVLEPTMASKLQGDYKTDKRINIKKVGATLLTFIETYIVICCLKRFLFTCIY